MVFICQQSYLLLFGIPSPTHSFIPGLKLPSLQILPTAALPFFYLNIHYVESADCLLLFLSKAVTRGVFWVFEHPQNFREKLDTQKQIYN